MKKARYIHLADMLSAAIESGKLVPGTKLPTHRAFAQQFNVALATATRVYGELDRRGMIIGEAGRGTYVRDLALPPTLGVQHTANDDLIDLVFNMPGEATDADILRAGLRRLATAGDLEAMLRYQPHGGRTHERRIIAKSLATTLGKVDPECLLVTSGGQHGLATLALGLFRRGQAIATDTLTYPGFKSVAALQGLDLVAVDGDDGAMDPDALDRQCRQGKLRAVYLMPTVHNPLGTVMSETTRLRLVSIARKHDLFIIEDAAYAFLEPEPPPSLITLAPERTIHVGSFSKSLATGLRLGYVVAPAAHVEKLLGAIRATTWNAPALISGLVTGWIEDGTLAKSQLTRRQDGAARQLLCRSAFDGMPLLSHRNAGFAWVPLAKGTRAEPIVTRLKEQGFSVSGADPFATGGAAPQALRLAFGGLAKDDLPAIFQTVRAAITEVSGI
ncbi:transcriptional regulator, GntR family [Pseudosulfitobacter pseudonitzschiae]|uniref:GntR family transcriptional regulator n=1 Tax=Pseudosulfitobacter pseudonitzschiae TaxID=1402135 RepID=A0A073J5H4_9RHOB|nr:PLP-dependent aminotransferase family protein [Pseudosulfitobacter pseudonitzschiae]KEJ97883.1 GntR family transcriptional regulator [Pseudosulfitobacter pseudonitzschiae]QKS09140.1 PLP-dependent aminotransferase family protein [Pseudosulfitobacter pseudonitzschiae]SHE54700.1 transcriptional regulator, GntR family [Pseudosulfitobacter pseudonitzschiae]